MNLQNLLAENIGLLLIAALTVFAVSTVSSVRRLVQTIRQFKTTSQSQGRRQSWFAVGWAVLSLGFSAGGLFFFGGGVLEMGPALLEQGRIVGSAAPEFKYLRLVDGEEGRLADHKGKVVLVNIWATWCPPCRAEMPALERLHQAYGQDGLVVLNISDEKRDRITTFLESQPMTTVHGYVEKIPWPTAGRPTSYLIDREGVVRKAFLGERDFETFERMVRELL